MSNKSSNNNDNGSWMEILGDILSGILVGSSHLIWFVQENLLKPLRNLLGWQSHNHHLSSSSDDVTLKVVGVGYGRTGTYSLALALEELGYPTLHTQHMHEIRDILDMWTNQVFIPSIENKQATLGTPDLNLIARHGYQATMDLPTALYFESLLDKSDTTKFILTTRESSQVWFQSWDMLTKAITQPTRLFGSFSPSKQINLYYRWLFSLVNQDNSYLTTPMPLPDQDEVKAIESYEAHNARVRELIPPDRLLEYSVKQGWEPLCEFLEIEHCPHKPFPKTNSALSVQAQVVSAMVVPITAVVLIIVFVWRFWRFCCRNHEKRRDKKKSE